MIFDSVSFLKNMVQEAIDAVDPLKIVPDFLPEKPKGRVIVIGAGKASAAMAKAVENAWPDVTMEGIVVTRYGYGVSTDKIEIIEAAHPVPDAAGQKACARILDLLKTVTKDDLVLCLISGGGSALLSSPAPCLSFEEKQGINNALLRSGATIHEINCLRKHLSSIKGGQLALAAHPAKIKTLIISDVPGDNPATVASGPTLPDPTTQKQALEVVQKYNIPVSDTVMTWLSDPKNETPKADHPCFKEVDVQIISSAKHSLEAAEKYARAQGIEAIILGDDIEGESAVVAQEQIQKAGSAKPSQMTVFLSGGETTVTIKGKGGKGGPNTEFMLSSLITADGQKNIYGIAVDTDGIDGSEDNAGAFFTPETLKIAKEKNLEAQKYLAANDSYSFFKDIDGLVMTGPTYTNVNDFRAILVLPA